jgi:hypothetical protein
MGREQQLQADDEHENVTHAGTPCGASAINAGRTAHGRSHDHAPCCKPFRRSSRYRGATDAKKSCRAKYDAAVAKVLASTRAPCPPCLGATQAAQLRDETERDLDQIREKLYCAGTIPLP